MNQTNRDLAAGFHGSRTVLSLLLILFIGSGCAALIYEIVWFQLLELVIGSSAVSIGVLLGTFMGGMCLGSLLLPRFISPMHHPLRVYALMELGIGLIGLAVLYAMPLVGGVYTAWAGSGYAGMLWRGIIAAVCLLPPTLLMGATLPAISRWVETTPRGVSWLGFFYGGNIAGAVIGSLLAGFYLLRVHDTVVATYVAVALNVSIALFGLFIAKRTHYFPDVDERIAASMPKGAGSVYVTIGLSGMTALAAQVVWTRVLSLLFGATVYTFSLILAVFLVGLGIGSSVGSALARSMTRPRLALGWCQLFLCAAMTWAAYVLMESLPFWPIDVTLTADPWHKLQLDLIRCSWAVLPAAILWGASFPLALAAVATSGRDPGRLVGGVYAANTLGAIIGSMGASLILVAWIGSQHALQLLVALSAISALLMLGPVASVADRTKARLKFAVVVLLVVGTGALLALTISGVPRSFVAYGRFLPTRAKDVDVFYMGEGLTSSVAVSRMTNGILNYHNAGKVQASSDPADMRLQRMLGHLTTLVPANQGAFLVIGCGAGVTAGAVSIEPRAQSVTIAEIEPLVPEVVSTYFGEQNFNVIRNPKVRVEIDDGRHFLQTTTQKFDGITSDPLDPWVKGAAMLYTREFWELAKERLNPGGVVTVFVQLYESNEDAVKSEIATFFEAFPNGTVWANTVFGQGYDLVLLGQLEPTRLDLDQMQERLSSPEYAAVAKSLGEIGFYSVTDLLATFAGTASDLQPWLQGAAINRDRNLRLQYLAGLGLNLYQANAIYVNMTASGIRFPAELFSGSDTLMETLRYSIESGQRP